MIGEGGDLATMLVALGLNPNPSNLSKWYPVTVRRLITRSVVVAVFGSHFDLRLWNGKLVKTK